MVLRYLVLAALPVSLAACATDQQASYWLPETLEGQSITVMRSTYGDPVQSRAFEGGSGEDVFVMRSRLRGGESVTRDTSNQRVGSYPQNPVNDARQSQIVGAGVEGGGPTFQRVECYLTAHYDGDGLVTDVSIAPEACSSAG